MGRLGSFPHGIEILTTADYFTVSVRQNVSGSGHSAPTTACVPLPAISQLNEAAYASAPIITAAPLPHHPSPLQAYLSVAPHVAAFAEYFEPLAWHLLRFKLRHWEKGLRELAAQALAGARSWCLWWDVRGWCRLCACCARFLACLLTCSSLDACQPVLNPGPLCAPPPHPTAPAALVPHRAAFFVDHALPFLLPLCTDPVLEARHGAVAAVAELLPALRCAGSGGQPSWACCARFSRTGCDVKMWILCPRMPRHSRRVQPTCPGLLHRAAGAALPPALEAAAAEVVPAIERGRLTRGKGGEIMRSAICRLVETTSAAGLPLSDEQQQCLYAQLRDNLRHPAPEIQASAAAALAAFAGHYLPHTAPEAQQQLVQQSVAALEEAGNVAARRGGALALGALPRWLLQPQAAAVLAALAAASVPEEAAEARDAETRVNAVKALTAVALALLGQPAEGGSSSSCSGEAGLGSGGVPADATQLVVGGVIEPLLAALEDYSIDNRQARPRHGWLGSRTPCGVAMPCNRAIKVFQLCGLSTFHSAINLPCRRGDVGSWVREAAMEGLARLLPLLLPAAATQQPGLLPRLLELTQRALLAMLRQAVERIARMREAAAACLQQLLPAAQAAAVPMAAELAEAVQGRPLEQYSNLEALPPLAALIVHPPLQQTLLEGLMFSIGGLDAQLSAAAGNALADAVQEQLQASGGMKGRV